MGNQAASVETSTGRRVQPFKVRQCGPLAEALYLAPGASVLQRCSDGRLPPKAAAGAGGRLLRVVCVSDTHNEHHGLKLPGGELLIHSGDVLTESGQRGYVERNGKSIKGVKPEGIALFKFFAEWFGSLDYPHKVLIAGNHDSVLQGLGKVRVQQLLDQHTTAGKCTYLEHEEVCLNGVRIFGSPFAHWGGQNDAFLSKTCDYKDMSCGVDIMVTHMPVILPAKGGRQKEDPDMAAAMHRCGVRLHVSGHCHWAHGAYTSVGPSGASIPCVVASVCSGEWWGGPFNSHPENLASALGVRGDPLDAKWGGYNLDQPPIVCDIELDACEASLPPPAAEKISAAARQALLFFGPPNDPDFVDQVLPRAREIFDVDFVDTTADGVQAVTNRSYAACVAKLGTAGNLCYPIIEALRKAQGPGPFVAIHSQTAVRDKRLRQQLTDDLQVNLCVAPGEEDSLLAALASRLLPVAVGA